MTDNTSTADPAPLDWGTLAVEQLDWHWNAQLRPRLKRLSDEEYFWEPTPGAWSVRPRSTGSWTQGDDGPMAIDFAYPAPDPAPVTTIAWRLAHLIVGVFGARVASHFGGPPVDYDSFPYAGNAQTALDQLDEGYAAWLAGVRGWVADGTLGIPLGPAEGHFGHAPRAALVMHINRETIHHGAEIALLRDLWAHRDDEPHPNRQEADQDT